MSSREKRLIALISLVVCATAIFCLVLYYIPTLVYIAFIIGVCCVACYYHSGESLYVRLGPHPRRGLTIPPVLRRWLPGIANGVPTAGRVRSRTVNDDVRESVVFTGQRRFDSAICRKDATHSDSFILSPRDILMGSYIGKAKSPASVVGRPRAGASSGANTIAREQLTLRERLARPNQAVITPNRRLSFGGEPLGTMGRFTITPQRHYPLQQTGTSSVGILPPTQWDGFRKKNILTPRNSPAVHSPVTVKIARPDHNTTQSQLFDHLNSPGVLGSPGLGAPADPCSRETVLSVLKESRKRVVEDDRSFTAGQKSKRRRHDSSGSAHLAFEPLLPNGAPSQLVLNSLKRGLNAMVEESTMKRSRTSSISSVSCGLTPSGTLGSVRNSIRSSLSSSQGITQWKKASTRSLSPLSSPGSSRSQTPERASKKPREEDARSPSSVSLARSDKTLTDPAPTTGKLSPAPEVPVASASSDSAGSGKRKRKIPLVSSRRGDQISLPPPPELGYTITVKDLDQEKKAALSQINTVLKEPEPEKPAPVVTTSSKPPMSDNPTPTLLASHLTVSMPARVAAPIPVINLDPVPSNNINTAPTSTAFPVTNTPAANPLLESLKMMRNNPLTSAADNPTVTTPAPLVPAEQKSKTSLTAPQATLPSLSQPAPPSLSQPAPPSLSQPAPPSLSQPAPPSLSQPAPPSLSQPAPPSLSQPALPSLSQPAPPSLSQPALPSLSQPAPPSLSQPAPPSLSQPAPPSLSQPAPPSLSQPAPPSLSQPAPPSLSQPAPPSRSQPAPPSLSQPAPPSLSQPAPPSLSQPAPPSLSQPAPPSLSQPAPPSLSQPAPPSLSQPAPPSLSQPAPPSLSQPAPPSRSQPASTMPSAFTQALSQVTKAPSSVPILGGASLFGMANPLTAPSSSLGPTTTTTTETTSSNNPLLASVFKPIFGATALAPEGTPALPTFKPIFGSATATSAFGQPASTSAPSNASTSAIVFSRLTNSSTVAPAASLFTGLSNSTNPATPPSVKSLFGNWSALPATTAATTTATGSTFQFGTASTTASGPTLSSTAAATTSNSGFSFGAMTTTSATTQPTPSATTQGGFTFGQPVATQSSTTASFGGFGMATAATATAPTPANQSTFTFGKSSFEAPAASVFPGAIQAPAATAAANPFTFGSPATGATPAPFAFGAAATTATSTFGTTTKLAFGANSTGFAFGNTTGTPAAPAFGSATQTVGILPASAPTFSFGGVSTQQAPATPAQPATGGFNFGAAISGTQFGTSNPTTQTPGFNFGTSTPAFGQSTAAGPVPFGSPGTPVQGFSAMGSSSFGSPSAPSFSIGAGSKTSGARQRLQARRQHPRKK
ncbi:nuclear envelope pore membrane protein POM 121-like isoform X2 [Oncorhynchus masou masou]|uniref:nuclear envelope pore membrane protein POM 121-like isoform X2 n=1 Tax=Oncorhynchus masou masou TaxID=90313 RepID=UPI0031843AED